MPCCARNTELLKDWRHRHTEDAAVDAKLARLLDSGDDETTSSSMVAVRQLSWSLDGVSSPSLSVDVSPEGAIERDPSSSVKLHCLRNKSHHQLDKQGDHHNASLIQDTTLAAVFLRLKPSAIKLRPIVQSFIAIACFRTRFASSYRPVPCSGTQGNSVHVAQRQRTVIRHITKRTPPVPRRLRPPSSLRHH